LYEQFFFVGIYLAGTITLLVPMLLGASGEMLSQKSGLLNVGIEGYMLVGAFFSYLGSYLTGNPWLGVLFGMAIAGLFALLNALLCVRLHMNQIITGFALWYIAIGITAAASYAIFRGVLFPVSRFESVSIPILVDIPLIGEALFDNLVITYIAFIILIILNFILFKSTFGLNIRAVGDNPSAADSMGINVYKTRYLCGLVSGLASGLAGAYLVLGLAGVFSHGIIAGRGFVVLALVTFGRGKPFYILGGVFVFAVIDYIQLTMRVMGIGLAEAWLMLPYIFTILAMALAPERGAVSKTIMIPYKKPR
jgi:simple sugar transport system permease protein